MRFLKTLTLLVLAAGAGLALTACQPSDPDAPTVAQLTSLAIAPSPVKLDVNVTQPLQVTAKYSDGSTYDVSFSSTFTSSATGVATVNPQGVITAVAPGTAVVTARHTPSGQTATVPVTVNALRVMSFSVAPTPLALAPGASQAIVVTENYNNATSGTVTAGYTYSSSNTAAATVSSTGLVTGVAAGKATITATNTTSGTTATTSVRVMPFAPLVYASKYNQVDGGNWTSAEGGGASVYIDPAANSQYWWNGAAPNDNPPSFYFGYGIDSGARAGYFGAYVKAPGNGTAAVGGYSVMKIVIWGNDQLMGAKPTLTLLLKGPAVGGCTPVLQGSVAVPGAGPQTYAVPLNSFTLQTPCSYTSATQALAAGVKEVHVQVLGSNIYYGSGAPGLYPNGLNIGPISFINGVYASNYSQVDPGNWKSTEGGSAGNYIDARVPTQYWWNGVAPNDNPPNFFFGYGIDSGARAGYFGAYVKAPGNGTFDPVGYSHLQIAVWGNPELMNTKPQLTLLLKGPVVGTCTPVLQGAISVPGPGAQTYAVPLGSLTLQTACGYASPAAALAGGVSEVHVQVLDSNIYYGSGAPGLYPNGLNIGPISFISGIYASRYSQGSSNVLWKTTEGGDASTYIDTGVPTQYWWWGAAPADNPPNFYFGYGINSSTKPWGFGAYVKAPGNGLLSVSSFSTLEIPIWGNDQLTSTKPTFTLQLKGPKVAGCAPLLQRTVSVPGIGVQYYTVPLSSFALQTPVCPGFATAAQALAAGVAEVHVQVLGPNVQYSSGGDALGNYPNGLNLGPITFR